MQPDVGKLIRERVLEDPRFVSAVFSGESTGGAPPWIKVTIRPVKIRDRVMLQFESFETTRSITTNYDRDGAAGALEECVARSYRHCYIKSETRGLQIQRTKKGRVLVRKVALDAPARGDLSHDRPKKRLLTADGGLLAEIGIADATGAIKPTMQAKYRQINEFLKILHASLGPMDSGRAAPLRVVDFGCGNAYLTFSAFDYLHRVLGLSVHVTGVDRDAAAVERHERTAARLGWSGIDFTVSSIIGYQTTPPPDVVLALHACDTASDEALARAILWGSAHVLCVPCCHHDLQTQLQSPLVAPALRPVLRHGLLKQQLGDVATDAFRALILEASGYRVSVPQFVSPEHTTRNLMIAAFRSGEPASPSVFQDYRRLKELLHVTPHLETLLAASGSSIIPPGGAPPA